jgi:hypothetical protein
MPAQPRKMSEIMKEMSELLLRHPDKVPSPEAVHVALLFANVAWNESVGIDHARDGYRNVWETIEAENPELWNEFKSNDINGMIDELVQYKKTHFPDDRRRILTCGMLGDKVHVEWMPPAAPGVDSKWEMRLYGLVKTGQRDEAIRFLKETRRMSRKEAEKQVTKIAADLGLGSFPRHTRKPAVPAKAKSAGQASKRLHARLSQGGTDDLPTGKMPPHPGAPDMGKLIKEGFDPIHAAYIFVQHITSKFAEGASRLPEMKKYAQIVGKAEDEYLPSGPPMSPLTTSYFTTWALYDLQFDGTDTLASCLMASNDVVGMNPHQLDALKKMAASRMGIYEHVGMEGTHVRLRELLTDAEFACHSTSGYRGRKGELWYVRLFPPLEPELAPYHIVFTTPYILMASKEDWLQFLRRAMSEPGSPGLHRLLKHGPDPNYWNEFVFKAYHHHQSAAIFLAGIPDVKATLPHA